MVLGGVLWATAATAHQADTSYTRIRLDDERLATEATFDLDVLGRIVELDRDRDEIITRAELEAAAPTVQAYLRDHLLVSIDDGPPALGRPRAPRWPGDETIRITDWPRTLVDFPFVRSIDAHPGIVTLTYDLWRELGPSHTNLTSIAEAGTPELEVVFTQAEPDYDYFTSVPESATAPLGHFIRLGVVHLWRGFDHLLFLVALLAVSRLRELPEVVTAFTLAHSITLGLGALRVVELPSVLVEAGMAATVIWVAGQNLRGRAGARRWRSTFAFGLVHGFGFARVLRALDLPASAVLRSLAGFNVGVELGQAVVVATVFPAVLLLGRTRHGPVAVAGLSAAIGITGVVWLVERTFGFDWAPA